MSDTSRFIVGIDLGTTNSAVAYVDTDKTKNPHLAVQLFRVPQLNDKGRMEPLSTLPSFYYLAGEGELPKGTLLLPWSQEEPDFAVGLWAREQGSKVPTRLIHSAKSWLTNASANRKEKILPFEPSDEKRLMSPLEVSQSYLSHIREAWNAKFAKNDPTLILEEQTVILTVPASFDEVARSLTIESAMNAGLKRLTLLEEPQAAFYNWLMEHESEHQTLRAGDSIVVCDVGGGTSDFSLLHAISEKGGIGFQRSAVGRHLLLGGDNMDMAIAHFLESKLGRTELERDQRLFLRHQARIAKEYLLCKEPGAHYTFWLPGKGSQVIGGGISMDISFEEVEKLLLEGFFGVYDWEEALRIKRGSGVRTMGLPYESEPSITKHLASFLEKSGQKEKPRYLLFNGGAMKPSLFQERISSSIDRWYSEKEPVKILSSNSLDLAVAKGSAYFGKARRGFGIRVGGGSARSYYLAIDVKDSSGKMQKQVMTLVQRGAEEGFRYTPDRLFSLLPNRPVSFQLYHSNTRLRDLPGSLIPIDEEELMPLAPIQTILRYGKQKEVSIPVKLEVDMTEIGTLELWLISQVSDHRWKMEFQLRSHDQSDVVGEPRLSDETLDAHELEKAKKILGEAFSVGQKEGLKQLSADLEAHLGQPRAQWPPSVLRSFFDTLMTQSAKRALSVEYEGRFWNLAGFFLRPGFGYPLDDFRIKEIWKLILSDMSKAKVEEVELQQAICFRRLAAGLNKGQQLQIFNLLFPLVYDKRRGHLGIKGKRGGYIYSEYIRALGALELVDMPLKVKLGEALVLRIEKGEGEPCDYWALGRIGARHLLYGAIGNVISAELCAKWVVRLLAAPPARKAQLAFLLTLLARKTDCLEINLPTKLIGEVSHYLAQHSTQEELEGLLLHERSLSSKEREQFFGDSLPSGLVFSILS